MVHMDFTFANEVANFLGDLANNYNIEVKTEIVPLQKSYENFVKNYSDSMDELIRTKWRIIILSDRNGSSEYVMKYIYDKGFKAGDYVFFTLDPKPGV
jgi:hypothetical protein